MDYVIAKTKAPFLQSYEITGEECSYARRVLLFLARKKQSFEYEDGRLVTYFDYVGVGKLIDELVVCGGNREDPKLVDKIKNFSFVLCDLNKSLVDWAGLLYIQVPNGGLFDEKELHRDIIDNWKLYKTYIKSVNNIVKCAK